MSRWTRPVLVSAVFASIAFGSRGHTDEPPLKPGKPSPNTSTVDASATPAESALPKQLFKGKVVKIFEALKRRGVKAYPEELRDQVALETADELIPILPNWRGRAFFQDERLRDRDVELIGFRRPGLPYLSVMSVYTFDKGRRQYTDYWCDICSIPMYELKPCDCCQQEIRLRFEPQELPKDITTK